MKQYFFILISFVLIGNSNLAQNQVVLWHSGTALPDVIDWCGEVSSLAASVGAAVVENPIAEAIDLVVDATANITSAIASEFENHQYGDPHAVQLDFDKMINGGYHWSGDDSDIIWMQAVPNTSATAGHQTLFFVQPQGHWWKGIVAFNQSNTNHWAEIAYVSGNDYTIEVPWNTAAADDHYIVLSKAKSFGVQTNMYVITNWGDAPAGYDYHLYWIKT